MAKGVIEIHIMVQVSIHITDKGTGTASGRCRPQSRSASGCRSYSRTCRKHPRSRVRACLQVAEQITGKVATGFNGQPQTSSEGALEMVNGCDSFKILSPGKRTNRNCPARCFWMGFLFARSVTSVVDALGCFTASTVYGRYFLKKRPKNSVYRYETVPMMKKTCTQEIATNASRGAGIVRAWMNAMMKKIPM